MALYKDPTTDVNNKANYIHELERFRTAAELRTSTTFNDEFPLASLRSYIQGMNWTVTYFTQVNDAGDIDKDPDWKQSVGNQTYVCIFELLLKVQTAIDVARVQELGGEAIINASFRPKPGDAFIATLIGGRIACFVIREVNMEHYNLHQVYKVNYEIFTFLEDEKTTEIYNNLISHTIQYYVYNKDHVKEYNGSILTAEEIALKDDIKEAVEDLTEEYFKLFLDRDTKFLSLPGSGNNYVDQNLLRFIKKLISYKEFEEISQIQEVDYLMNKKVRYTLWDILEKRNPKLLAKLTRNLGWVRSPYQNVNLNSLTARNIGADYVIDLGGTPVLSAGCENTSANPDVSLDKYTRLHAVKRQTKLNVKKMSQILDITIPGLDFTTDYNEVITHPNAPTDDKDDTTNGDNTNDTSTNTTNDSNNNTDDSSTNSDLPNDSVTDDTTNDSTADDQTDTSTDDQSSTPVSQPAQDDGANNNTSMEATEKNLMENRPHVALNLSLNNLNPGDVVVEPAPKPKKVNGKIKTIKASKQYSFYNKDNG